VRRGHLFCVSSLLGGIGPTLVTGELTMADNDQAEKAAANGEAAAAPRRRIKLIVWAVDVPEMLVNLVGAPGERVQYLKVKLVLEVKDEPQVETIKPALPRVTDLFQTYMRELRPSDLNGSAGLFRLKEELTKRVNTAISPGHVNAVLFKEVVIQ
jgi:flagellar basal body-associated protein FliL